MLGSDLQPLVADPVRTPRVSVVIPAYNAVEHIEETLESVRAQSFDDLEIIVVDDGSTDGTAGVVAAVDDPRLRVVTQANAGQSAAQNAGLAAATGNYVLFLDSDDVLLADALERLVAAVNDAPEAVASYGPSLSMSEDGARKAPTRRLTKSHWPDGDVLATLLAGNFIPCPGCLLIWRTALVRTGGFDPKLIMSQDWEHWCRLALQGPFAFVGLVPVVAFRVRPSSVSRAEIEPAREWAAIDAVFEHAEIRARIGARHLRRLRRRREAQTYLLCGLEATRRRAWGQARRHLLATLRRRPISPWAIALTPFTFIGWLPPPIAERLVAY